MMIIETSINLLPPQHKKILKERVIEICFINDLKTSGWTDWVISENGDIYCVLAFRRSTLQTGLSNWLNSREKTCFFQESPEVDINIDTGTKHRGFLGVLLHETTHVVDYIENITPYVEPSTFALAVIQNKAFSNTYPFVDNVWESIATPLKMYNYGLRDSVTFYGYNNGPKLGFSKAKEVYDQLATTPFASLYGSKNWADDLADFVLFYHLTQKLKQPYTISVIENNNTRYSLEPMKNQKVLKRFPRMERFYRTEI
jgi:hypothetical protein